MDFFRELRENRRLEQELAEARAENERLREMVEPRTGYIAALSGRLNAALQERFDMLKRQSTEWLAEERDD